MNFQKRVTAGLIMACFESQYEIVSVNHKKMLMDLFCSNFQAFLPFSVVENYSILFTLIAFKSSVICFMCFRHPFLANIPEEDIFMIDAKMKSVSLACAHQGDKLSASGHSVDSCLNFSPMNAHKCQIETIREAMACLRFHSKHLWSERSCVEVCQVKSDESLRILKKFHGDSLFKRGFDDLGEFVKIAEEMTIETKKTV
jgi:hypothetical protein